jgi:hypothetical protein
MTLTLRRFRIALQRLREFAYGSHARCTSARGGDELLRARDEGGHSGGTVSIIFFTWKCSFETD